MRRSLGGGMIRNVQRAVMAGVGGGPPEPFSSSTSTIARNPKSLNKKQKTSPPNTALSLSSSSGADNNNNNNNGSLAFSSLINFPIDSDDLEWECVEVDEKGKCVICDDDDFLLGNVPSRDEVQHAVSALQQALGPPSYTHFSKQKRAEYTGKDEGLTNSIGSEMNSSSEEEESEMDWIEPSMHLYSSKMLQSYKTSRVYDAFNLMQNEPSIQRMVFSLSSDKAVWDAVLNNEVVKELRGSISQGNDKLGEGSVEGSNGSSPVNNILSWIVVDAPSTGSSPVNNILSWIAVNAKAKIMQLIDTITKLVNGVLEHTNDDKRGDGINPLEEKLKISLMLLVIVLLIVVVNRAQSA